MSQQGRKVSRLKLITIYQPASCSHTTCFFSVPSLGEDEEEADEDDLLTADEYWREYLNEMARKKVIEKLVMKLSSTRSRLSKKGYHDYLAWCHYGQSMYPMTTEPALRRRSSRWWRRRPRRRRWCRGTGLRPCRRPSDIRSRSSTCSSSPR